MDTAARTDKLGELVERMREAYEIGSPLIVQERLFSDFVVCVRLSGSLPPQVPLPFSAVTLHSLESFVEQAEYCSLATNC